MSRNWLLRILMVVGSVLILAGAALAGWEMATADERSVITVHLWQGKTETLQFENLSLVPGQSCEYEVELAGKGAAQYDLLLDFVESEDSSLKHYARVKIIADQSAIYDELLTTALESEALHLPVDFAENRNTQLKIVYYLPLEVGNEAQKAETNFALRITASNERGE